MSESTTRPLYNSKESKPLTSKNTLSKDIWITAYSKCMEFEEGPHDDKSDVIRARLLGYLLSEAPYELSQDYISNQIIKYSEVQGGLRRLADIYVRHMIKPVGTRRHSYELPTSQHFRNAVADSESTEEMHDLLKLIKLQNYSCPITNFVDLQSVNILEADGEDLSFLGNFDERQVELRPMHVMPQFYESSLSTIIDELPDEEPLTLQALWYGYTRIEIRELAGKGHASVSNRIWLEAITASFFGGFALWLEWNHNFKREIPAKFEFNVGLDEHLMNRQDDMYRSVVILDSTVSPRLDFLRVHASLARAFVLSGSWKITWKLGKNTIW